MNTKIINPVTNEEMSGCVWYYWNEENKQYIFEYDSECKKTDDPPEVNIVYNNELINNNGWAKENISVSITGIGEIKYCIGNSECEPNDIIETGNNTKFITIEGTNYICAIASNSLGSSEKKCEFIKLDKTVPVAGTANLVGTMGSNAWYTSDVTVNVANGSDNLSGHLSTTSNVSSITNNTTGQVVTITTTDLAGNSANRSYTIKLDKNSPTLTDKGGSITIYQGNSNIVSNYFNVGYSISGGSVSCNPANTNSLGVGTQTVSCTATGGNGKSVTFNKQITVKAKPVSFATDSWETIADAVKNGNTGMYNVGDEKEVTINGYGTFTVRIANMSTPTECATEGFSQTACGFVVEFVDPIVARSMNGDGFTRTNVGGWPASEMYITINNIYNSLQQDLKNVIIDTYTVSGYGSKDSANFVSTDKLYLLSPKEIWEGPSNMSPLYYDTAKDYTRQLDYYKNNNVTNDNYSAAIKYDSDGIHAISWWLRTAVQGSWYKFAYVENDGSHNTDTSYYSYRAAPAFRIGQLLKDKFINLIYNFILVF